MQASRRIHRSSLSSNTEIMKWTSLKIMQFIISPLVNSSCPLTFFTLTKVRRLVQFLVNWLRISTILSYWLRMETAVISCKYNAACLTCWWGRIIGCQGEIKRAPCKMALCSSLGMYKLLCRLIWLIHSYKLISSGRLISRKYRLKTSSNTCEKNNLTKIK